MSTGGNTVRYKEQLKKLKDNDGFEVFAFSGSFMFCVNELEFYPDYFLFIDPNSAMLALEHISKNKHKIKTKVILLDPIHTGLSYEKFVDWYGTTPVGSGGNHGGWSRFMELTNGLMDDDVVDTISIPVLTVKHIKNKNDTVLYNFGQRVNDNNVIIRNQLDDNFNEDKLTSVVLPVLYKMKMNDVYLIGFDCMGGRYFTKLDPYAISRYPEKEEASKSKTDYFLATTANRGMDEAKQSTKMFLPEWNKYIKCTNLVEDRYTYLNKFIDYKPIEEVIA